MCCLWPISLWHTDTVPGPHTPGGDVPTTSECHLFLKSSWNRISWRRTVQHFWPVREWPTHNPEFVDSISPQSPSHHHVCVSSDYLDVTGRFFLHPSSIPSCSSISSSPSVDDPPTRVVLVLSLGEKKRPTTRHLHPAISVPKKGRSCLVFIFIEVEFSFLISRRIGEPGHVTWVSPPPTDGDTCNDPSTGMDNTINTESSQVMGLFPCLWGYRSTSKGTDVV